MTNKTVVYDIRELTKAQLSAVLDKAEIKGTGNFKMPELDLEAIRERSEQLDAKSQIKADIWMLLAEVERLRKGNRN